MPEKKKTKKRKYTPKKKVDVVKTEPTTEIEWGHCPEPEPKPKPKPKPKLQPKPKVPDYDYADLKHFAELVDGKTGNRIDLYDWDSGLDNLLERGYIKAVRRNLAIRTWLTPKGVEELNKDKR